MGAILLRLGLSNVLGVIMRPGFFIALSLVLALGAGIYGAWWGLSSNRHATAAWKARAQALELAAQQWEAIASQDAEQALRDMAKIEQAKQVLDEDKHDDKTNETLARWRTDDIWLFRKIRKAARDKR